MKTKWPYATKLQIFMTKNSKPFQRNKYLHVIYGDMGMKIEVESVSDKLPLEKMFHWFILNQVIMIVKILFIHKYFQKNVYIKF